MSKTKTQPKRAGGRPQIGPEPLLTSSFRRTATQAVKLEALGGNAWLREQIDAAPWPRGSKPK